MVLTCAVGLSAWVLALSCAQSCLAAPISLAAHEAYAGGHMIDHPTAPLIGRYQIDAGGAFVLDRSAPKPMMKFDDAGEIWALQPAPGPRGDTIYRNDLGEPMLRSTRMGGMTVFTEKRPDGSAAAFDGASPPLRLPAVSPPQLYRLFYQASIKASRAAFHQIGFETGQDADSTSAAYVADAAAVASEALVEIGSLPNGRLSLAGITDVVITEGGKANVVLQHRVLTITIVIAEGIAGRPSSRRIEKVAYGR